MEDLKKELFELANEVASNLGYSIYDLGLGRRGKKRLTLRSRSISSMDMFL